MNYYIEQLVNGIQKGSIYALVALGYTMVYGIVKLINFAHGEFIMVGVYSTLFSIPWLLSTGLPVWLCIIIAMIICSVLGVVTEKVAYKPLRHSKRITALITAIAVSLLIQNLFMLMFTSSSRFFYPVFDKSKVYIGSIGISKVAIIIIVISITSMILLQLFIKKTKMGKAMRAVSENPDAAMLMGVNINNTISMTFAIGAGLAGIAAIMYGSYFPSFNPFIGSQLGLKAFVAAVLGGIGIIPGAIVGGFLIGIIEGMSDTFVGSEYSDIIVFSILIIVLLFKPSGLFGKNKGEKV